MQKNIVFVGPPGCGKGTQALFLKDSLSLSHISTGAILRQEIERQTEIGIQLKETMDKGFFPPESMVLDVLTTYLASHSRESGFIFDGFPRTVSQAEWFDKFLLSQGTSLSCVIYFAINEEVLIKRLSGRFTCSVCGATYNEYFKKPHRHGSCDVCGATGFSRRSDDALEHINQRFRVYEDQTKPLISFYRSKGLLREVDVTRSMEEVSKEILAIVEC